VSPPLAIDELGQGRDAHYSPTRRCAVLADPNSPRWPFASGSAPPTSSEPRTKRHFAARSHRVLTQGCNTNSER